MLARLISSFIIIFVGLAIAPQIAQQINNAINCNLTTMNSTNTYQSAPGPTDSFGGGGADYHFGGYNGEVKHKVFLSDQALIKTNESIIGCVDMTDSEKTMLGFTPTFFMIAMIAGGVAVFFNVMRSSFWDVDGGL